MDAPRYTLASALQPGQFADVFSNEITPERGVKMHRHDFYEFFWLKTGKLLHTINGQEQELSCGDLVMIQPEDTHSLYALDEHGGTIENTAFRQDFLEKHLALASDTQWFGEPYAQRSTSIAPTVSTSPAQLAMLRQIHQHTIRNNASDIAVTALLTCIKSVVSHALDHTTGSHAAPLWLKELRADMTQPEHVILGRAALRKLCDKNLSYIHRVWKQYFDQTPGQFINAERIALAKVALTHAEQDITAICFDVGFNDLSYFFRLFKQQCGCSPLQYRKHNSYLSK
jgi:AraC family cel operon transcriptional repressor